MQELQEKDFDYSLVDNETAIKLEKYEKQLNRIYNSYSIEVGEVLYNAQEELSNYGDGTFIKWAESKGIKKASVYNYINAYKFVQQLDKPEDKETFLTQPKKLQYAMSKPSAREEINQAVLNGEVKSSKEYKELERQLKQRDEEKSQLESQLEQAKRSESIVQKQLEDAEDKEPEVVEHYMEPEDYQELKHKSEELERYNQELKSKLKSLEATPKKEEPAVENQTFTDYRDEINAHTDAVEPEVKKAMQHETSAKAYMAAIDEIITITDDEITDFELFERYIATMDYKLIGKAKAKIETLMQLGGYK